MNPEDRVSAIADRIADGSAVDWPADSSQTDPAERAILEQLKAIAELATLHRRPSDWTPDLGAPEGTPWGPLTITSKIGEGRYGQVYLAWDARLQRRVALKLLRAPSPTASASPAHAIEEARLLARVRHSNVLAVHGAECLDEQIGIWTEFIEGRTLEDLLKQHGPMAPDDVVAIGLDLCRALGAVHAAGLLHRDIKAQNVMRETGGRIVLMDFGTGHDLEARPARAGDLSGTPLYLAPEILAGGEATPASDVYALAVLLFRLLTGEYPVPGRTLADVQAGHQQGSAARLSAARPELPARLVAAIDRGLAAEPRQRHGNAVAFEEALEAGDASRQRAPNRGFSGAWRPIWRLAAILLTLAVGAPLLLKILNPAPTWVIRPLTIDGHASAGDISPDGTLTAYLGDIDRSVWTRRMDTDTDKDQKIYEAPAPSIRVMAATVAPNDQWVDILLSTRELWRVSLLRSGENTKILDGVASPPGWAPDGRRMAVLAGGPPFTVVILDADGGPKREFATPPAPQLFLGYGYPIFPAASRPTWSPDGRTIAVAGLTTLEPEMSAQITLIDTQNGALRNVGSMMQLTADAPVIVEVAWFDEHRLIVNHQLDGQGPYQLSLLDLATGSYAPLRRDSVSYEGLSATRDRQFLVSTAIDSRRGIWVGNGDGLAMSPVVPEQRSRPRSPSFDRSGDLVYCQDTKDGPEIMILRHGAATSVPVARGFFPRVAENGQFVVFAGAERPGLFRTDLDGAHTSQILSGALTAFDITPNSQTLYLNWTRSDITSTWAVPIAGGQPREVVRKSAMLPQVSHDGGRLMRRLNRSNPYESAIVICDLPGCLNRFEIPVPRYRQFAIGWTPDDRGAAFIFNEGDTDNIWIQPLDGGPRKQLTTFTDGRQILGFDWSPDGQKLAVTRGVIVSDVVMLRRSK